MKTVILCGGKGTRLREETEYRPKPMVPIGSRPILWHIMNRFSRFGYSDFVLCLGYKGEVIKEYFRNFKWNTHDVTVSLNTPGRPEFHGGEATANMRVTMCDTGLEAPTGARISSVRHLVGSSPFFLTYGDGVGNVDLAKLLAHHKKSKAICTITAVHPPGRFGEVAFRENGSVASFNEKPQTEGGYINGGFMVCDPAIFEYLPKDRPAMLEEEPLRRLAAAGKLAAYKHEGFWQPMDTYQEFTLLNRLWAEGKAPWM